MLLFEILECGFYNEQKGIYASQKVVVACWKHWDMIFAVDHVLWQFRFIQIEINLSHIS